MFTEREAVVGVKDNQRAVPECYDSQDKKGTALHHLKDLKPFMRNLWAKGVFAEQPLAGYTDQAIVPNTDFVPADAIRKLQDLTTVAWDDFLDVRDRMICFTLLYDFALRRSEPVGLDMDDISVNDMVQIRCYSEVQKGQGKKEVVLYSCFEESRTLTHRYIEMRYQCGSSDPAFLIARSGRRLLSSGVSRAVESQCQKLGIKTFKGEKPTPHRFRHSFGTLNVEPLGISMSVYQLMGRLRHEDYRTTHRIYIDDNPLLQKERHIEMLRKSRATSPTPQESASPSIRIEASGGFDLTEGDAIEMLSKFDVKVPALRKHAAQTRQGGKQDGRWLYSKDHVEDLANNFVLKQDACDMLKMSQKQLHHYGKRHRLKRVVIGKASLIRAADLFGALRGEDSADRSAAGR